MTTVNRGRRRFLRGCLVAAAATTATVGGSGIAHAGLTDAQARRYVTRMLSGVELGVPYYRDWAVIDAMSPRAGGMVLVVANGRGRPIRVDVCRRGEPPMAPAYTRQLELVVMDGGEGQQHVPSELVEALQVLCERLQDNEAQWLLAEHLLTHRERVAQYPAFMKRAACELSPKPFP